MGVYLVKPGYVLQLGNRFLQPGSEVELTGEQEDKVLAEQGWKVTPASPPKTEAPETKTPEGPTKEKAPQAPPKDRAIKDGDAATK